MAPVATADSTTTATNGAAKPVKAAAAVPVFNPFYSPDVSGDANDGDYQFAKYKARTLALPLSCILSATLTSFSALTRYASGLKSRGRMSRIAAMACPNCQRTQSFLTHIILNERATANDLLVDSLSPLGRPYYVVDPVPRPLPHGGEDLRPVRTALLGYDYLLTLSDEVRLMWRSSTNLSTISYRVIRYGTIVTVLSSTLYQLLGPQALSDRFSSIGCQSLCDIMVISQLVTATASSLFVAVRLAALWSSNWYLGVFLFLMGLINASSLGQVLNLTFRGDLAPAPLPGCVEDTGNSTMGLLSYYYLSIAMSSINMAYEMLCFLLTAIKTYGTPALAGRGTSSKLLNMLCGLRDQSQISREELSTYSSASRTLTPRLDCGHDGLSPCSLVPILTMRFIANLQRGHVNGALSECSSRSLSTLQFAARERTRTERFLQPLCGELAISEDGGEDCIDVEDEPAHGTEEAVPPVDQILDA
ncbi:hypothetical protein NUW54_g2101 [Trametes sanguinea]|uniref:Uncharacterized protein n=1 Tax=Trametes sanguinea TaxID=158606 RepID=A0ACC1Q5T3_9APHY|nr:hypothetical protein NUW54_g2101 [Trametes sanguinea]